MYFSYATKYTSDGWNYSYYRLWELMHPEDHMVPHTVIIMARNKIFLFLHCYQPPTMSSQQKMVQSWSSYPGLWKLEAKPDDVLENRCLTTCFSPHVNVYNFSFHYNIHWKLCCIYHLFSWPRCLKDPSAQPLPLHNLHNQKLLETGKNFHLNSATAMYCSNSNRGSITQIHYDLHWETFPPFWKIKINVHMISWAITF